MARVVHLEVKLPPHVRPTDETSEQLIKKFLKETSKESLVQKWADESAHSRRFTKKSVLDRQKRLQRNRNAKKYNDESNNELPVKQKKKKKFYDSKKRSTEQKSQ